MSKFRSVLLFPEGHGEGRFEFEAPDAFLDGSPSRIVDSFLSSVQGLSLPDAPIDNEINSALKDRDAKAITASGKIILRSGGTVPFVAMISAVPAV